MHRLYDDLAPWWPLISPPGEYAEEIPRLIDLLGADGGDLLELGSGGGHVASHLSGRFALTLVDLSPAMLAVSQALNPTAAHVVGDMRTVRVGRTFDAFLVHDAVDYLLTEADVAALLATAAVHLRRGGRLVLAPDHLRENYEPGTEHGGADAADGRGARYLSWSWDPDPTDTTIRTDYVFALREADGQVSVVHDSHVTGLFEAATWRRLLAEAGFVDAVVDVDELPDWGPRILIHAVRP